MIRGRVAARALAELLGDWRGPGPAYLALAGRIRLLLLDGRLSADTRLPAERELATALLLSRTTVTAAYGALRDDGFVRSVTGSGTTTALPGPAPAAPPLAHGVIDLTKASLPATAQVAEVLDDATTALRGLLGGAGYESLGLPGLRRAIADRYTARGLPTTPEEVLVTAGAQSAIALLARTLIARGDRVYAESPSYPNAFDALRAAGGRVVTSPVTVEHGWDLEALAGVFRRTVPTVGYVIPDFHNPTGRSMDHDGRHALLRAAAGVGAVLIADETTAELAIDTGRSPVPLAAMGADYGVQVVQVGSASKVFWGGLRVGWVRGTPQLIRRLAVERAVADLAAPVFEQLVVERLLPRVAEVVAERRAQLAERRAVLADAVAEALPGWTFPPVLQGGMAAWINLGEPASSQLALAARAGGVLVNAGPRFGVDGAFETFLRLPITAEPQELRDAVAVLARLWPGVVRAPHTAFEDVASVA